MKKSTIIIGTAVLFAFTVPAAAEVAVKEVPLSWEQVAKLDGRELYSNLCASCHGFSGKGDGPAVSAVQKDVPDLTRLASDNGGVYSRKKVERAIAGDSRTGTHSTLDMPVWRHQFMYVRPGWNSFMREAYARERIQTLNTHIESLQVAYSE